MSIPVSCPSCHYAFRARDEYAGKRAKCPGCGEILEVPEAVGVEGAGSAKEKGALPPVRRAPASASSAVATPAAVAPVMPEPVFSAPTTRPSTPVAARDGAGGPLRGQPVAKAAVPVWVWIAAACAITGLVVGAGVYAAVGLRHSAGETAAKDRPAKGAKSSDDAESPKPPKKGAKKPAKEDDDSIGIGFQTDEHGNVKRPPATVAKSMEEVLKAVVKIEIPVSSGAMSMGTGFFIDDRGWVATNHHVIAQANKSAKVVLSDGTQCRIAGILADASDQDLAILKIEDPPVRLNVLDLSYQGDPALTEDVRACGHPHNVSFTFVKGCVGRVANTAELLKERPNPVLQQMKAPMDLVWIQHDAKIAQGNSGGPLVNKDGQVLGVNSFVNELNFGYAVHVRHLRALKALCDEKTVTPLPEHAPGPAPKPDPQPGPQPPQPGPQPKPPGPSALTAEGLKQLFDECAAFKWKPETQEQFGSLATFARAMNAARMMPDLAPKADELFGEMKKAGWTAEHFTAINKFAADQVEKVGMGVICFGSVAINGTMLNSQEMVLLQIEGSPKRVMLRVSGEVAKSAVGSKWLVLGEVTNRMVTLNDNQGHSEQCHEVASSYMFAVQ